MEEAAIVVSGSTEGQKVLSKRRRDTAITLFHTLQGAFTNYGTNLSRFGDCLAENFDLRLRPSMSFERCREVDAGNGRP